MDGWVALEERPVPLHSGQSTRIDGYAVIGVSPGREVWAGRRSPTRSPFVGRARELELLDSVLEQVKAGRGQVVSLVVAAGMGKSRLLDEFRQRLSGQRVHYAEGQCLAYGGTIPYLPILDLLRDYCGIAAGDGPEALAAKMRLALERSGGDLAAELSLLLDLLGVPVAAGQFGGHSADGRRARTFEALYQIFLASSRQQPFVLAVDNAHWTDPTSEAFLAGLIERLASVPLLVLTTARPGYRPPWGERSYVMQLALQPLDPDASRQVVQYVLAHQPLTPEIEQQLLAKAEGNPFFLEELSHAVREQEGRSVALAVPNTIQAVLAARIDRLPLEERRLLQTAAVIGLEVPVALLQAIAEVPEEALRRCLAHLQASEFLYETRLFPEREYTFKHALTHEVAYSSLLQEPRRALHTRIVEVLEGLAKERAMGICHEEDLPAYSPRMAATLGAGYTLGGRIADAVSLLTQAMERAIVTEMVVYQGFCRLSLGEAQVLVGRLEKAKALAEHTLALAREHQERGNETYALRLPGEVAAQRDPPEAEQAEAYYRQALALADELAMRPLQAHCHRGLGMLYRGTGQQAQARTELLAANALYRTMEMTFWLPETEAALTQVQGADERL